MMATSKVNGGVAPNKKLIRSALLGAGVENIDGNVLIKCVALASTLQLTPEVMAEVWEAHSLNKQNLTELTMHQFEAYKNELIKASTTVVAPDSAVSSTVNGAIVVSRGISTKREAPPATLVTPTSLSKRQKQSTPDAVTSFVDQLAIKGNIVPSPTHSSKTFRSVKCTPINLPKYEERTKVGHVVSSYPADCSSDSHSDDSQSEYRKCTLITKVLGNDNENSSFDDVARYNITTSYRHMFTTLEDRSDALERHLVRTKNTMISDIEKEFRNKNTQTQLDDVMVSFEEVNVPRQHSSTCIGRICNEAHNGKMNKTSIVLEGSSASCGGARINVDLSHMQKKEQQRFGYSLFPGQIVAIEGMNGTGRKITATKIREGASLPPPSSSAHTMLKYYGEDDQERKIQPLKVISACGPFTTSKNMDYAPFVDLMHVVLEESPNVVILMGPFVDVRQEAVKSGRVTFDDGGEEQETVVDYEAFFSHRISGVIEEVFESLDEKKLKTEFVLVPALEDAVAKFVYPQPPLQDRMPKGTKLLNIPGAEGIEFGSLGLHRLTNPKSNKGCRVHCLPNPCTFRINELIFGVTSTDVVFHTSVEETNANLPAGSRLRRIAQHLIQQQSYYPVFPPNKSVNLDLKQQDGWRMPCRPDVLFVPSRLTPFCAPVLGNTLVVNPGHLTKGTTGGTYSVMTIHPMKNDKLKMHATSAGDTKITHDVQNRTQIKIKRI